MIVRKLFFPHIRIGDNDNDIAFYCQAGGGAVKAYVAFAFFPFDGVSCETRAVVDVQHMHLLVRNDIGCPQELLIDGDAALIIDVGIGDMGPVDFAL
jgi:hypothetical protein